MTQPPKQKWREFWITELKNIDKTECKVFESEVEANRHCFIYLEEGICSYHVIEHEAYLEQQALLDECEKAIKRLVTSEALKEAPFYSYCESIVNAQELLTKLRERKGE